MLTPLPTPHETPRNLRRERRLWHDGTRHTPSMGCAKCPDHEVCGGLQVGDALFDCLGFCCHNPADCDAVCRNKAEEFAQRVREVGGFSFDNVPRSPIISAPSLPAVVPLLYIAGRSVINQIVENQISHVSRLESMDEKLAKLMSSTPELTSPVDVQ
jgi:hypothetical protein